MRDAIRLLGSILALGAAAATASAATVELVSVKDNTLYQSATGALSNGKGAHFFVGRTDQPSDSLRRGLVAFDLATAVPAGSVITGATLQLYLSRTPAEAGPRAISLRRVNAAWGEGTSNDNAQEGNGAAATPGDATWIHRSYDTQFWSAAGGDFATAVSASTSVNAAGFYTWSGAGVAADVQAWIDSPATNFGWIVLGDESTNKTAKRFDTREETTAAQRPRLLLAFTPPAQTGACCSGSGDCLIVTAATCSVTGGAYQGDGTTCTPNQCPQPTGACCKPDGSCSIQNQPACALGGGTYQGAGTTCTPNQCPQPLGACCLPGQPGSCSALGATACASAGGAFSGVGTDCLVDLCPYVDALPRPGVATPISGTAGGAATYELKVQQVQQKLHRDLPATTLWGYGGSYPGPTIEAAADAPVSVTWVNDLRDANGDLRTTHLLPVDTCLHGPDMEGATPRVVTHLHGGHSPWASDGYPLATLLPGERTTYEYPNHQVPATLWYHDHALGITRLNVYLGLAGYYLLRDPAEQALGLPSGVHELGLAIQDRNVGTDGALQYPALWQDEVMGDKMLVNGKVWPYLDVDRGWYRFRILNGSNGRTLMLSLSQGLAFQVLGSDGGLLPAPVSLPTIRLGPGERADVAVNFGALAPGTQVLLTNSAPAPYPGVPGVGVVPRVMQFRVGAAPGHATPPPAALRPVPRLDESAAAGTRTLELRKVSTSACGDGSAWTVNGVGWDDEITERPTLGTTEVWRFVNRSGISHPMHLHLSMFQVLDRQPYVVVDGVVTPSGPAVPAAPEEAGWKDTVMVNPSEIVRVIVPFEDYEGLYPYHCHMLEHEDHDMMRQFELRADSVFGDGFE